MSKISNIRGGGISNVNYRNRQRAEFMMFMMMIKFRNSLLVVDLHVFFD